MVAADQECINGARLIALGCRAIFDEFCEMQTTKNGLTSVENSKRFAHDWSQWGWLGALKGIWRRLNDVEERSCWLENAFHPRVSGARQGVPRRSSASGRHGAAFWAIGVRARPAPVWFHEQMDLAVAVPVGRASCGAQPGGDDGEFQARHGRLVGREGFYLDGE